MEKETANKIAMFRYGIIASYISDSQHTYPTAEAFFRAASKKTYRDPFGKERQPDASTVRRWYMAYMENGYEGLKPHRRTDLGKPRKLDTDLQEKIRFVKQTYPRIPATVIYQKLLSDGTVTPKDVSLSLVTRYAKQIETECQMTSNKEMRRYMLEHINEVWGGDTCYGPYLKDEKGIRHRVYLIGLIDNASRMITGMDIFFNDNSVNLMKVMRAAVSKYGKPARWCFDNGKTYRNQQIEMLTARIGTTIQYSAPYTPTDKAFMERFWRTLRDHWMSGLDMREYHDMDELRQSLFRCINEYNHTAHSSLDGQTPDQRFFSESEKIIRLSDKKIDDSFMFEVERRVSIDNVIVIDQVEYEVPYRYSKMRIRLRYAPDLSRIYIIEDNDSLTEIKLLDKHANAKAKRKTILLTQESSGAE